MNLFTGVLFIILVLFCAGIYAMFITSTNFLGYVGCCSYNPINHGQFIFLLETGCLASLLIYIILLRNFRVSRIAVFANFILSFLIVNLGFVAYQIFEFPRVIQQADWGFYSNPQPLNDQVLGFYYNPLIPIFLLFALGMLWPNCLHKTRASTVVYCMANFIIVGLFVAVGIIIGNSIAYEMCMG